MPERDATIRLRGGRILAYTEHGDLSGKPVFFIHGNPSSRLIRHPDENDRGKAGRTHYYAGYGRSTFQPGRKLLDFPDDIVQLTVADEPNHACAICQKHRGEVSVLGGVIYEDEMWSMYTNL